MIFHANDSGNPKMKGSGVEKSACPGQTKETIIAEITRIKSIRLFLIVNANGEFESGLFFLDMQESIVLY